MGEKIVSALPIATGANRSEIVDQPRSQFIRDAAVTQNYYLPSLIALIRLSIPFIFSTIRSLLCTPTYGLAAAIMTGMTSSRFADEPRVETDTDHKLSAL